MRVDQFLARADKYLRHGDVVLCKGKATLFSLLIRWWTKSHFSHTALVFEVPSPEEGYDSTFLIEASLNGVDITDLKHYAYDLPLAYDVAIRRLNQPWFDLGVQRAVRGNMLNFIKAKYDYAKIVTFIRSILGAMVFGLALPVEGSDKAVRRGMKAAKAMPGRFVCSGFVQYGFINAMRHLAPEKRVPGSALHDVTFNPRIGPGADDEAILGTTPEDFARTDKLSWEYVIRKRRVYRVSTYAEVDRILSRR